jgi:alpha-amylase
VRIGLHYSGPLLEWLDARHPEFIEKLKAMAERGQVEILGGGFYEPILVAIPPQDQQEQILRMREYIRKKFKSAPAGAWLAERVWEPQLPGALEAAKVEYTLLDDVHFTSAGIETEDLFGYHIAEDRGAKVKVIPGLKALRYLVPFRDVEETIGFLRSAAERHPGGMAAMGDDCEKFGAWPGTYDHCYRDGWVERFFAALERNREWLAVTPPGEYLREHAPLGRADLPTASYTEMMEWVLPTQARQQLHAVQIEFSARPDVLRFLRGGIWRGFLGKYPEVNLLHKKMLDVSRRVDEAGKRKLASSARRKLKQAYTHLLRAQSNDAYWHGVFGGLYLPHLRTEMWRELIRAEGMLDEIGKTRSPGIRAESKDFDLDGVKEISVGGRNFSAIVKPSDGATIAALDFRPTAVALINSLQRRPEAYHSKLAEAARGSAGGVSSIHDSVRVKEPGLEERLRYDRWARHSFRLLLFPQGKTWKDYETLKLGESGEFAAGAYRAKKSTRDNFVLDIEAPLSWQRADSSAPHIIAKKEFQLQESGEGFSVKCAVSLRGAGQAMSGRVQILAGIEIVLNFLAPNEPDRYFEYAGTAKPERQRLGWGGEIARTELRVVDEWQNVAASIGIPSGGKMWVAPIETVSESEEGFERVYQGTQILGVCAVELAAGGEWNGIWQLNVVKSHK